MTASNIGQNIRSLRESRGATQEQLAQALDISFQAVSKWETGVTVPDTLMLPKIAAYFDVTVDALFRPEADAYASAAQRLLSVYEQSRDRNDFIRAEAEFIKLFDSGEYTRDDVRAYGVLNEYRMYDCRDTALKQYEKLLAGPERDRAYRSARQQRIYLLSQIGRGDEALEEERRNYTEHPGEPDAVLYLMAALYWTGRCEEVLAVFEESKGRLGDMESLCCVYAGASCGKLGRYDEAFEHWERSVELDPDLLDPLYSMARCLGEQGKYAEEAMAWERVIDSLPERGWVHELAFPREQLKKARDKLSAG